MALIGHRWISVLVSILLACVAAAASAQGAPSPVKRKPSPHELHLQRIEMNLIQAESRWALEKKESYRFDLIFALEEMVNAICLPKLRRDLDFAGRPTDPNCVKLLIRLREMDLTSPVYQCVHEGFSSPQCEEAYQRQIALSHRDVNQLGIDLSELPHLPSSARYTINHSTVEELEKKYTETKTTETRAALVGEYRKIFGGTCHPIALRIVPEKKYLAMKSTFQNRKAAASVADLRQLVSSFEKEMNKKKSHWNQHEGDAQNQKKGTAPTEALLDSLGDEKSAQKMQPKEGTEVIRIRVLPDRCDEYVTRLLSVEPLSSLAICQRDGFYATQCIQAIKQERRMLRGKSSGSSQTNGASGFGTF